MNKSENEIFRFRKFPVYQEMRTVRQELRKLATIFPKEEKFALTQQLWRASDSVLLNITEGSEKYSDKDFSHFLNMALGSVNEIVACLDAALDECYILKSQHENFLKKLNSIARQLKAFLAKVRKDNY